MESHLGDRRSGAGRVMGLGGVFFTSPDPAASTPGIRTTSGSIRAISRAPRFLPEDMPAHADASASRAYARTRSSSNV
jgi:hypothetical protein